MRALATFVADVVHLLDCAGITSWQFSAYTAHESVAGWFELRQLDNGRLHIVYYPPGAICTMHADVERFRSYADLRHAA